MPGYQINSEACRRQGFHFRQVYAALRFSRDKNKAGILDVHWDCGFLGVKDGIITEVFLLSPLFFDNSLFFHDFLTFSGEIKSIGLFFTTILCDKNLELFRRYR